MKRILKTIAFFGLLGGLTLFVSCSKIEKDSYDYSPELEAQMTKAWINQMIAKKIDIDTTVNGVFYHVDSLGTGPFISVGDTVQVKYVGMFTDGETFDSSLLHGDGTLTYVHKDSNPNKRLIPGWEEGIEKLNQGGKAFFLVPSRLAYGSSGSLKIPPYTPLVFVIEVLKVK